MRTRIFLISFICAILISLSSVGQTQVIAPNPISAQIPQEILAGVVGKYISMIQQYQYLVSQGQKPESAVSMRIAASLDLSGLGLEGEEILDPALKDISKMAFWVNANIFGRQPYNFAVDLAGSFGNIKFLNSDNGALLASFDEGIFSNIPLSSIKDTAGEISPVELPDLPMSAEEIQQLTIILLAGLAGVDTEYEGLLPTPKGMAHVVKLIPLEDMVLTLWILDRTWDLCKVEFYDVQDGIVASMNIDKIELVTVVPDSEFILDTSMLSEVTYDSMIGILGLKIIAVAANGIPVVSDLYTSSPEVLQGQKIQVISNAFDSKDEESELTPLFEYRSPDGVWQTLEAKYVGATPLGNWQANFAPSVDGMPGIYSFKVSYTDKSGNVSEFFELKNAVEVMPVLPRIVKTMPADREQNVSVLSTIAITFSQKMNEESAESAFSLIDSSGATVEGSFEWSDNFVTFKPSQSLNYGQTYVFKISGSAMASNGALLDTNGNGVAEGSPKDDLSARFTLEAYPTLAIDLQKTSKEITKGDIVTLKVMAESMSELSSFAFEVKFDPTILKVFKVDRTSFADWRPRPKDIGEHDIWSPVIIDNDNGKIILAVSKTRDTGVSGSGALATIIFDAINEGESTISFDNVSLSNIFEQAIQPAFRDVKVVVKDFGLYDLNKDGIVNILDFIEMRPDGQADVNNDGVIDVLDIVAAMGSGINIGIWDVNGDGIVDIQDFIIVRTENGAELDTNGDGVVDILDIVYLLNGSLLSPMAPLASDLGISYPNPCNPEAWIPFKLADGADVSVKIFNSRGQLVKNIDLGYRNPGIYVAKSSSAYWDGMNENGEKVPSGIYFYNIKAGNFTATKKMIVLK